MNAIKSQGIRALALVCGLGVGAMAQAASTWTFSGSGTSSAIPGEELAKTGVYTGSDANLTISGAYVANTGTGGAGPADGTQKFNTATNNATAPYSSPLYFAGAGLGMCSDPISATSCPTSNPANHAIDNLKNTEGILLNFTTKVALQQIYLGFTSTDSDVSVFRYTGVGANGVAATTNLSSVYGSQQGLTNAGWELVGNYADVAQDTSTAAPNQNVNAGGLTSTWWLITAYNSGLAGTSKASGTSLSDGNDFFKIFAAAGTACATSLVNGVCGGTNIGKLPEPATLALTSVALVGVAGLRRRKTKAAV